MLFLITFATLPVTSTELYDVCVLIACRRSVEDAYTPVHLGYQCEYASRAIAQILILVIVLL